MNKRKYNIAIVSGLFDNIIGESIVNDAIRIVKPFADGIYCITGDINISDADAYSVKISPGRQRRSIIVRSLRFLWRQVVIAWHTFRIAGRADVFIFREGAGIFLLPAIAVKLRGKKLIVTAPGLFSKSTQHTGNRFLGSLYSILEKVVFNRADSLIIEGEGSVSFLGLGRYRKKISVSAVRQVDTRALKIERTLDQRESCIGFLGGFIERKGILNLARAIPLVLLRHPKANFILGGHGPLFEQVNAELARDGFAGRINLPGWVSPQELPAYFNRLKLLILPSYSEGLPTVAVEAMACGTPVLATPVGGIPDVIEDGRTGFILPDNSPESIAAGICRVLSYPDLESMVQNARRLVEDNFGFERISRNFEKIVRQTVER